MQNKVDLAAYSFSPEYRDGLLVLFVSGILLPTSLFTLALLITLNYKIYMSKKISPVAHSSSAWYGYGSNTARRIALGIAALTLLLLVLAVHSLGIEYSNILNTAILIAAGIAGFLLSFEIVPFIAHLNYKTNMSSEISPVVHSSNAWYGYGSNTARRIALAIAALTLLLLVLAVHSLGVEYSNILNTAILIAAVIAGVLLPFYLVPLSKPRNHKTNTSGKTTFRVVHGSMIGDSDNKPSQRGKGSFYRQIPLGYSEFTSRRPRPRMIVRA